MGGLYKGGLYSGGGGGLYKEGKLRYDLKLVYILTTTYIMTFFLICYVGPPRRAPEGTWVLGGGIEIPCQYKIIGPKKFTKSTAEKN